MSLESCGDERAAPVLKDGYGVSTSLDCFFCCLEGNHLRATFFKLFKSAKEVIVCFVLDLIILIKCEFLLKLKSDKAIYP